MDHDTKSGRIVVGIDGSPGSIDALREAGWLARATDSWLDVVTCWNDAVFVPARSSADISGAEAAAQTMLQDSVSKTFGTPLPPKISTSVVRGGTRQKLLELSEGADMLVLGQRGFGGFAGLKLGSVSQACVARAHCPVLVVNAGHDGGSPWLDQW